MADDLVVKPTSRERTRQAGFIAQATELDGTLAFVREGYLFGIRRYRRLGADAFRTRLFGRPVVVARGADALRFFSEGGRFERNGAMPTSATHLLQDERSVQTLEGAAHAHRKAFFLDALEPAGRARLAETVHDSVLDRLGSHPPGARVVLQEEFAHAIASAALQWAGVPERLRGDDGHAGALVSMIEGAGTFGPPNWTARMRRLGTETWAREVIDAARAARGGPGEVPEGSPLDRIAGARADDGALLDRGTAAVELLNLLRPIVAVGRFGVFAALALHRHPRAADEFARGDADGTDADERRTWFVNEVRRCYPFFPMIVGRATRELHWHDEVLRPGTWMLVDLYGTNHDPRHWEAPERFDPGRFAHWEGDPNTLVPQGGGRMAEDHRCPGEPTTIDLMREIVLLLTRELDYEVVTDQDLRISARRIPATPESGLIVELGDRASGLREAARPQTCTRTPAPSAMP